MINKLKTKLQKKAKSIKVNETEQFIITQLNILKYKIDELTDVVNNLLKSK